MIVMPITGKRAPTAAAARSETRLRKNASTKLSESDSSRLQSNGQVRLQSPFSSTGADFDKRWTYNARRRGDSGSQIETSRSDAVGRELATTVPAFYLRARP